MLKKTKKEMLEEFRQKCKDNNLSITPQRTAIYNTLIKSNNHPACEDIYNRVRSSFPDIAIDTIYRTLSTFSEIELIREVEGYGEAKRYDSEIESHHHFRCRKCNKIVDFFEKSFDKLKVPKIIKDKYTVTNTKVLFEGLCDKCLKK